jgi:citrate synthase
MGMISSLIASMSAFYPNDNDPEVADVNFRRLIGQIKTMAAFTYRWSVGQPLVYPKRDLDYCSNFLRMMFGSPVDEYKIPAVLRNAINMLLIVHADHEQNCSTSTVRMVGSSQANIFASISAGVCALWGPLHGGANQAVLEMLAEIEADGGDCKKSMEMAKDKNSGFRLMGFGHRVYKNFDPRAIILKKACDDVLSHLGLSDPMLDIAKNLEAIALEDDFFVERKLYPNVDFYSGILYRALGIPINMFTVMFTMGRMPGWIAQWKEASEEGGRIHRPRQIYVGPNERDYKA